MRFTFLLLGLVAVMAPQVVLAEDFAGDVPDRVWVDFGGQINDLNSEVAVTGAAGVGTTIDFEDIFDLPGSKTTGRMFGTVRISEKRRWIDFGYVLMDRSGTRTIQNDIIWGDNTFAAGGQITAKFDSQFIYSAFRYDFLHEEKVRISGSAGLSFSRFAVGLEGDGTVTDSGGTVTAGHFDKEEDVHAPVPLVGMNLDWALTKRLTVRLYSRFFRLNYNGNKGGLFENGIHLNWYFIRHFGMGVGYDKTQIRADSLKLNGDRTGKFDYELTGVGIYFNLAF